MTTILIFIAAIVALSAIVFVALRKTEKIKKTEIEPLGYETAPILEPTVEVNKKKKAGRPKTSKNTAKNASLAKMEAKPKKATKAKK